MSFTLRVTSVPSLQDLLATAQQVVVDLTGKSIPLGAAKKAACLIGEFVSGPFLPRQATSDADLNAVYGSDVLTLMSQSAAGVQDGSGVRFEGNGRASLLGRQFGKLVIQRVDTDMVVDDTVTPGVKAYVKFSIAVDATDQDPLDATKTGRDIIVPAGRRFGDQAIGTATVVVALSQKIVIAKGTPITGGKIGIAFNLYQNVDGDLRLPLAAENLVANSGATAFMVKGTTLVIGGGSGFSASPLDTAIDTALPGVLSTISATQTDIGAITSGGAATAIFAPGTSGGALAAKIESLYSAMIDRTRPTGDPQNTIGYTWSARRGASAGVIRNPLVQNAIDSSKEGPGRVAIVAGPYIGTGPGESVSVSAGKTAVYAMGAAETPGSGADTADRRIIAWPYDQMFCPELNRMIDVEPAGWMASILSINKPYLNPGMATALLAEIQALQSPFLASPLGYADYVNLRSKGIAALRHDTDVGWQFQDGVTSADPTVQQPRAPIKRRIMADRLEDGMTSIGARYDKGPVTTEETDAFVAELRAFMEEETTAGGVQASKVDEKSGNTDDTIALGLFVVKVFARTTASRDTIMFIATIGETVDVPA